MDILIGIFTILGAIATIWLAWIEFLKRNPHYLLQKHIPGEFYSEDILALSTQYYVQPDCIAKFGTHSRDPVFPQDKKTPLFEQVDRFLNTAQRDPYLWVLGDSGMGKTSFVLNYYAYNRRRLPWNRKRIAVIPLNNPDVEEHIKKIEKRHKTILFLDGFDEDVQARGDYQNRLNELMQLCKRFKRLVITSRSQFFPSNAAIPYKTSVPRHGPRAAGTPGVLTFSKVYLLPLTGKQILSYLFKRFRHNERNKREPAYTFIKKIPNLAMRPMLLTYIPELLQSGKTFKYTYEIYKEMVNAWIEREDIYVPNKQALWDFSERLAIDLYSKRMERGAERIPRNELAPLANQWGISLNEWQLSSRSLLSRDALNYYKFAHRSIMEYLFVKRVLAEKMNLSEIEFTDQMKAFLCEMTGWPKEKVQLEGDGQPPLSLRATPTILDDEQVSTMLRENGFFDSIKN
ncbi:MAG: NACHT domain-containing protein [bacterium]